MSDRVYLPRELEAVLRARGVAVRDLNVVLNELHLCYRQFSLRSDASMLDGFLTFFQKVAHFAVFAHAPHMSNQVA